MPWKRTDFAASPIDTVDMLEPQEEHFVRDFLKLSHFVATQLMSATRLPAIVIASHKMPSVPWKLHVVTSRSPDNAIRKTKTSAAAIWNETGGLQSAPAMKTATHLLKRTQTYCACHTTGLSAPYETCGMSQSARPAMWEATRCLDHRKVRARHRQTQPQPQSGTGSLVARDEEGLALLQRSRDTWPGKTIQWAGCIHLERVFYNGHHSN